MNGWLDKWASKYMDGLTDCGMDDECMYEWIDEWKDGWIDKWRDGWIDKWIKI